MFTGARILVAPLDWGLGHAARCVPVIRELLKQGAVPVIGADKGPLALLRDEFPELEHVRIPGLEVRYGSGGSQAWAMAKQIPAMLRQARKEQLAFNQLRHELRLDAVISDQRFGIRTADIPSVLITHQVFPFSPFAQGVARRINRQYIDRFDLCWIPDHAEMPGLSGELSHGTDMPGNARYIGPLSRFKPDASSISPVPDRIVAVISGPEPQRAMLERQVLAQLLPIEGSHVVITGNPGTQNIQKGNTLLIGHLNAEALCNALIHAELIISRTGYSTLMDLDAIGRGALLVPTPGQPEQEYLGRMHGKHGSHLIQEQHRLDIASALTNPPGAAPTIQKTAELLPALSELARLIIQRRTSSPTSA